MSIFRKIILVLNAFAVMVLLLAYLGPYISPATFWQLAFLGLIYPVVFVINLLFVLYWILRKSKYFLIPFIALLPGFYLFGNIYQFRFEKPITVKTTNHIKVMTFNVRLFDLYNWSNNKQTRNEIFEFIRSENPDVIALQEFYADDENSFINIDTLKKKINLPYDDYEYTLTMRKKNHWGIATFSRFPVVGSGHVNFRKKSNNICIYSDLLINKDTVRVYNMHLQSIHLLKEDYKFINEIGRDSIEVDEIKGSRKILGRLKRAFVKRAEQCDSVAKSIQASKHPIIVCGDFNDTPASYAYHTVAKNLKDAFIESGTGWGQTYIGIFPSYRIDYILHSNQFSSNNFITHNQKLSDHYAISCLIKIR